VLAAVHGPLQPSRASVEEADKAVLSVIFAQQPDWEPLLQTVLEQCICLKHYPRCVVEVVLQTVFNDGSELSCALHAAVAALMDAGIAMYKLPIATTMVIDNDGLCLDPSLDEERQTMATLVTNNLNADQVVACVGTKLSLEQLLQCQEAASRATPAVVAFLRLAIEQKVQRQAKTVFVGCTN
jgi:ribonuclease PH